MIDVDEDADGEEDAPESFEELQEQLDLTLGLDWDVELEDVEEWAAELRQSDDWDVESARSETLAEWASALGDLQDALGDAVSRCEDELESRMEPGDEIGEFSLVESHRKTIDDPAAAIEQLRDAGVEVTSIATVKDDQRALELAEAAGVDITEIGSVSAASAATAAESVGIDPEELGIERNYYEYLRS